MIQEGEGRGPGARGVSIRYAVDFAVRGDLRYCSHRDMIRLFARAFARADLPVRFSAGFNPHPVFSLPLPRPVGVGTEADRLVVELVEPLDSEALVRRLSDAMPEGITILGARALDSAESCRPTSVEYTVSLSGQDREELTSRISRLLASPAVIVERKNKKDGTLKRVDIHHYLETLSATETGLMMRLRVSQEGTVRPAEVCAALGITDPAVHAWTHRTRIEWH